MLGQKSVADDWSNERIVYGAQEKSNLFRFFSPLVLDLLAVEYTE